MFELQISIPHNDFDVSCKDVWNELKTYTFEQNGFMEKHFSRFCMMLCAVFLLSLLLIGSSCDRDSSPEGRMSLKLESLQKEMIDSLKQQNKVMLDSLGNIRKEIEALKQSKN